jgi:adenine-specific DNA-methyltransferase
MKRLDGESLDIVNENVAKLKELFPEVFSEGKIDFKKLEEELGQFTDADAERYNFTWAGKTEAKKIAQTPSAGTLRPSLGESKNWDTTQNLYIEGDNLEVLKLLQKSYHKKVKMIYIDPPYNTGKDFVYKDNFRDNIKNYMQITGQVDSEGNRLSTNSETNGRYHSDWLNMMYPRLKLARNLLRDDGVIAISIDEKEVYNLKKVCDEVFGEENFAGEIIWKNSSKNDQDYISIQHEYILVYVRDKNINKGNWVEKKEGLKEIYKAFEGFKAKHGNDWETIHKEALVWYKQFPESNPIFSSKHYNWMDDEGVYFPDNISGPNHGQYVYDVQHPVTGKICKSPASGWRYPEETLKKRIEQGLVHFGKDHTTVPNNKTYLKNTEFQSLTSVRYKDGRVASKNLTKLFGENIFTNPKDSDLMFDLFKSFEVSGDDLVLDFFAGSATIAETVFKLNQFTGTHCKFILVQFPEDLRETLKTATGGAKATVARAIKYLESKQKALNVCEIGKERISLLKQKIKEDSPEYQGDLGFKVFKLDSSNIKAWDSDFENLETNLLDAVDNIKSDRNSEDLLYEVLLKYGLNLTLPIEEKAINGSKIFVIGFGALIVCLDNHIALETVNHIAKLKEEYASEITRVVFKDSSFADAVVKTNALQTLKQFGIDEVVSI